LEKYLGNKPGTTHMLDCQAGSPHLLSSLPAGNLQPSVGCPGFLHAWVWGPQDKICQPTLDEEKAAWKLDQTSLITGEIWALSLEPTAGNHSPPFTLLTVLTALPKN